MSKRYFYLVGLSIVFGPEVRTMNLEVFCSQPLTHIQDVNGWLKTTVVEGLDGSHPEWDLMASTWRQEVVILGCSLLRTEVQQPNGEWVAA